MSKEQVVRKSNLTLSVGLNKDNLPVEMEWSADDHPNGSQPEAIKAMLVALFSETQKETLRIDLWTKEMQVVEMDRFMYQSLRGLAQTYFKATQNKELADQFQRFVFYFGRETGLIPDEKPE